MADPYEILQVSPGAGDDEVKAAYRELARKYHPDNFAGNPLSDLATEKMKEINEAYDEIMNRRRNGGSGNGAQSSGSYGGASQYPDIRRLINLRRITEAEELLDGVPRERREAEWFFLKGTVQQFRGWLDDALQNYSQACGLAPNNPEYRNAYSQLQWQSRNAAPSGYRTGPVGTQGCSICDVCAAFYCADCICNCLGGGC